MSEWMYSLGTGYREKASKSEMNMNKMANTLEIVYNEVE